nr:immunoglobulin light chain junction region [Macaca mulatta]
CVHAIAFPWTF